MFIDRLIGFVSPTSELKRTRARLVTGLLKRKYEGASNTRRTAGWRTSGSSQNKEAEGDLAKLRERSRDLVRNNPYASRGIAVIANNAVGRGIIPAFKRNGKVEPAIQEIWKQWAETTEIDDDAMMNIYGIQNLAMRAVVESGECFIRKIVSPGATFPFRLQVLESDFLPVNTLTASKSNSVVQGIELDAAGRRLAYHFYTEHPGDNKASLSTVRVPASEVIHIYRRERPGQLRGIPWLASVIIKLRDFDEFEDAQLVRQKIAACFSVFVQDIEAASDLGSTDSDLIEKLEPGLIETLPPGKQVTFANPPGVTGYQEYSSVILHSIAAGLGVTYESLTGDLSQVNFSSARMGWLEFQRNIEVWRSVMIDAQMNATLSLWFYEGLIILGINPVGIMAQWTAPRREMIDPTREVPAKVTAIRAGIETLSDVIRERGKHPLDHFNDIAEDNTIIDSLNLVLDSDPRRTASNGSNQANQSQETPNNDQDNSTTSNADS
jgi:lambda family phage portal protein